MLWNICSVLFLASGACEGLKEYTFRKRLEREGYEIDDNRSTTEKVLGFIRNYAYLLVPVYNIYRAGKKLFKDEDEYYASRFNSFNKKGLLVKREEVKEKEQSKQVEQAKEVKREVKSEPKKVVNVQSENKGYTIDEMIHMRNYYMNQDRRLRARYKTLKEKGASASEINEVVRTIKEVDSKYYELDNAILASRTNKAARVKKQ